MGKLIHEEESYQIIGASFDVYNQMGCGFLEAVYQECLEIELRRREVPYQSQQVLELKYRGELLHQKYKADFLCFQNIIVEIKATDHLTDQHRAQIQNYLHATSFPLGLLINFGHYPKLEYQRIALTNSPKIRRN